MPHLNLQDATALIRLRHSERFEHQRHWRFLFDSYEGGDRYRYADYYPDPAQPGNLNAETAGLASDSPWYASGGPIDPATAEPNRLFYGKISQANLVPHLSEMGTQGRDLYAMRLARTPVPALVERAVEAHLSRVFTQEVRRAGPPALESWWADVDGRGTPMDRWVQETAGPLLLVLGQLDVLMDRPRAPAGVTVRSRADERRYGLDKAVASVVLPENVLWWELDPRGAEYEQALILERAAGRAWFRHLTRTDSNAYTLKGEWLAAASREHGLGVVPMRRVFDRRKPRCGHVGKSRYASIAELQKAVYNARSELILEDIQGSHALLQGPEDFVQGEDAVPVGPDGILPMRKNTSGTSTTYQAWSYLDPPKGAQAEVRVHIQDFQDEADRDGALARPAGMSGGAVTAQSGVSKIMDQVDGNALLARVAATLQAAEAAWAGLALAVLGGKAPDPAALDAVTVTYPRQFEMYTAADLSQALTDVQAIAQGAGALPTLQGELLNRLVGVLLPGIDDERLGAIRDEVDAFLAAASEEPESEPETPAEAQADGTQVMPAGVGQTVSVPA